MMQIWSRRNDELFNKKLQKDTSRGQITFGIQLQTFSWHCNKRKLKPNSWNIDEKKLNAKTEAAISIKSMR